MTSFRSGLARAMLGLAVATLGWAGIAATAQARIVTSPVTHKHFGIVPRVGGRSAHARPSSPTPDCATDCGALLYGGGPVQHGEQAYLLFWDPSGSMPAVYKTGLGQLVNDLAGASGTTPISVTQQYYDNSGPGGAQNFARLQVQNGGSLTDTHPFSDGCPIASGYTHCVTDTQIENELTGYITANHLPTGINVEYFVFTPSGVDSCFDESGSQCASNTFCGYHSIYQLPGSGLSVPYAGMPWGDGVQGCDGGAPHLNSNFIDPVVDTFSHELSETITDPDTEAGWIDSQGNELADKCVGLYGSNLPTLSGAAYNVQLGSDHYLMQSEFSNHTLNCEVNLPLPLNSGPPQISGDARQGSSLSESHGSWSNATSFVYQWEDCDSAGQNCSPIPGASGQTYRLGAGDAGHTVRVAEAAINSAGASSPALSAPTALILPAAPAITSAPSISGPTLEGHTLSYSHGRWANGPSAFADQWERCNSAGAACAAVPGANGSRYRLTGADIGHTIRVLEVASNAGGSKRGSSGATSAVAPSAQRVKRWRTRLGQLVKTGGSTYDFSSPGAGRLTIVVKQGGAVVARGSRRFNSARNARVMVRVTGSGRNQHLRHPLKLQLVFTFTPAGGAATSVRRTFQI